jgi:hypothetical protein
MLGKARPRKRARLYTGARLCYLAVQAGGPRGARHEHRVDRRLVKALGEDLGEEGGKRRAGRGHTHHQKARPATVRSS